MDNTILVSEKSRNPVPLPMKGTDKAGNLFQADNISLLKNGKRFLPVMGEFHYSRYLAQEWEEEILKMKAGGISIVASYVFWIHHEERKGEWDFTGCRDLRRFLTACEKCGVYVWLRIGPWAHGECRNGGFPDWLVKECGERVRSEDPGYLENVRHFFHAIGQQAQNMTVRDGGPILGIQLENEYGHCGGKVSAEDGKRHLLHLKQMAIEEGLEAPYYTATGWGSCIVAEGETLPVLGGYADAPWEQHVMPMPASENFLFSPYMRDENIGSDLRNQVNTEYMFDISRNPYLTAELGGGMQVTSHRRVYSFPEDTEAQTLCVLGSGANMLGYYMYHGGVNPDGKETSLQETRETGHWCDLPAKSYDFQA